MRQHALIGALIVAGAGAQAAPVALGEDELRSAVAGKTVTIDTPLGLPISVNYGANGIMTGTAGAAMAVYLGAPKDRGRWQIKNGKLCQKWFKWLSSEVTCLAIQQEGLKIYWRSDEGRTGTAMIEPGPPVIDGATASGLGLPPQPAEPQAEPAEHAAALAQQPHRPAPSPQRREVAHARPVHAASFAPAAAPAPTHASFAREPVREHEPPVREHETAPEHVAVPEHAAPPAAPEHAAAPPEHAAPALVEAPQVVMPARAPTEPSAARFAVAALMPLRPAAPAAEPLTAATREADPFEAEREPMRTAAEAVSLGVMEHRWCLANAFAKGPQPPHLTAEAMEPTPELVSAPSLLAVTQEQAYDGELPLHEPACLTEQPALGAMARLIGE
jgi:hypothetical protein